ncbi:hypothetical protein KIPB_005548 [Kipferlia bialata]|uniref:PH domain-containing protein n=1 Tax=Kipferlia bialata TaxID=797122 RepID=A0A9K3CVS5_9EUKA|nr:hypothetical protein KIPB_005548 [Kipferlia bialata]|eukprot:g5548.t1
MFSCCGSKKQRLRIQALEAENVLPLSQGESYSVSVEHGVLTISDEFQTVLVESPLQTDSFIGVQPEGFLLSLELSSGANLTLAAPDADSYQAWVESLSHHCAGQPVISQATAAYGQAISGVLSAPFMWRRRKLQITGTEVVVYKGGDQVEYRHQIGEVKQALFPLPSGDGGPDLSVLVLASGPYQSVCTGTTPALRQWEAALEANGVPKSVPLQQAFSGFIPT